MTHHEWQGLGCHHNSIEIMGGSIVLLVHSIRFLSQVSEVVLFYTICVFCTIRVWYIPYAYTRTVQPYAYGTENRTI